MKRIFPIFAATNTKNLRTEKKYMQRCLDLAVNGLGLTYPNPLVGCVIVHRGRIIGEGWHQKAGEAHAEVHAINSVKDRSLLPESALYVNLEPCSHYGKTPPCADLILKSKIKRVVVGCLDVNEKVSCKGVEHLRDNGCEVVVGCMERECRELNRRFFTCHEKKRPYVILKWAETRDGFVFPAEELASAGPAWISNRYSLQRVHQWRGQEASILVGNRTVLQDDPRLSVRDYAGNSLIRMVIDRNRKIPEHMSFFNGEIPTIVFNEKKDVDWQGVRFVKIDFSGSVVQQVLEYLAGIEVQSLIVEGGPFTLQKFIESGLWDEARVFVGNSEFGSGVKAPRLNLPPLKEEKVGGDRLIWYRNRKAK